MIVNEIHPSLLKKKIIHIDMDCFFAAVEMRDNPSFKGIPLAVGGSAEKRGVIATCNYEARKFGIHSAMAQNWIIFGVCSVFAALCFNNYRSAR